VNKEKLLDAFMSPVESDLGYHRKALTRLDELSAEYLPGVLRKLNGSALLALPNTPWRVEVNTCHFSANWKKAKAHAGIDVRMYIENITAWADLVPFFDLLENFGITEESDFSSYDDAASFTRIFNVDIYKKGSEDGEFGHISIRIHASLVGDTELCKRVVVGYTDARMVEAEPIYELKCEE
jgi:hypothetical protein